MDKALGTRPIAGFSVAAAGADLLESSLHPNPPRVIRDDDVKEGEIQQAAVG